MRPTYEPSKNIYYPFGRIPDQSTQPVKSIDQIRGEYYANVFAKIEQNHPVVFHLPPKKEVPKGGELFDDQNAYLAKVVSDSYPFHDHYKIVVDPLGQPGFTSPTMLGNVYLSTKCINPKCTKYTIIPCNRSQMEKVWERKYKGVGLCHYCDSLGYILKKENVDLYTLFHPK
jgi:hypothetical protein